MNHWKQKPLTRQPGTALITVVLIAAFVIVLVVESVKTIKYQKQLSNNLINRDQAYSYLIGMEELAKILLKRGFDAEKEKRVHLNQPWAQDEIIFPIEGGMMSASVRDLQSCFNLNSINLPAEDKTSSQADFSSAQAQKETPGQAVFEELSNQLLENTEVTGKALAAATRDWLDEDIEAYQADGAEDDYYMGLTPPYRTANSGIVHTSELRAIKGFDRTIYQQLHPYICVLPDENVNRVNINTLKEGGEKLLYAILGDANIGLSQIKQALSNRGEDGFESVDEFLQGLDKDKSKIRNTEMLDITSNYFEVTAKAEIGTTRVRLKTLFKRDDKNNFSVASRYYGKE